MKELSFSQIGTVVDKSSANCVDGMGTRVTAFPQGSFMQDSYNEKPHEHQSTPNNTIPHTADPEGNYSKKNSR